MSLSLWPPNPLPPVDILILIVAAVGSVLAVRRFIYDLRHPPGAASIPIEPSNVPPATST